MQPPLPSTTTTSTCAPSSELKLDKEGKSAGQDYSFSLWIPEEFQARTRRRPRPTCLPRLRWEAGNCGHMVGGCNWHTALKGADHSALPLHCPAGGHAAAHGQRRQGAG